MRQMYKKVTAAGVYGSHTQFKCPLKTWIFDTYKKYINIFSVEILGTLATYSLTTKGPIN